MCDLIPSVFQVGLEEETSCNDPTLMEVEAAEAQQQEEDEHETEGEGEFLTLLDQCDQLVATVTSLLPL